MENFAVDLDKVLDEFELNEDEHENASQYDKLQLEFRKEKIPSVVNQSQLSTSLGASWDDPGLDISTEEREPPDGQHDDEDCASVCQKTFGSSIENKNSNNSEISNTSLFNISKVNPINDNQSSYEENPHFMVTPKSSTSNPEICSNDKLWPNLSNSSSIFKDIPVGRPNVLTSSISFSTGSNFDNNNKNPTSSAGATSEVSYLNNSMNSCPLDVIPSDIPSTTGPPNIHEGQHPDILDMSLNSKENVHEIEHIESASRETESFQNEQPHSVSPDIQREAFLLPDLMPVSSSDSGRVTLDLPHLLELPNPAIVTENSCSKLHTSNDPVIILESQSANRIPEVVNVHQSAELQTVMDSVSELCSNNPQGDELEDPEILPEMPSNLNDKDDGNNEGNLISVHHYEDYEENQFDNKSVNDDHNSNLETLSIQENDKEIKEDKTSCVRFDPNLDIDENQLHCELQDLEEDDQNTLQGAYKNPCSLVAEEISINISNMGDCNNSNSPDLIGNIGSVSELDSREAREDEVVCETSDDTLVKCAKPDGHKEENVVNSDSVVTDAENNINDLAVLPVENNRYDSDLSSNLPEDCESVQKPEVNEETFSESTGTDTLSSTSTLTEGEIGVVENQSEQVPVESDKLPEPSSPSREMPGSLVTAVYDDAGSSGAYAQNPSEGNERDFRNIGAVAPFWIPDEEAPNCLECGMKFTVIKRRHHCRGCGRVLCAPCCHSKVPLPYMDFKEARVCATCLHILTQGNDKEDEVIDGRQSGRCPNPNNPMEYCSRIPPQQQVGAVGSGPPPTVMVPVGVLKREVSNSGNGCSSRSRGSKQVIFSDGIRPGGDLTELGGQTRPSSPFRKMGRNTRRVAQTVPRSSSGGSVYNGGQGMQLGGDLTPLRSVAPDTCLIPSGGGLPPVLLKSSSNGEYMFDSNPDSTKLEQQMEEGGDPVVFALQKNLTVLVKKVKLDCCMGLTVWNVVTRGLCNVGQEELVVLLVVNPEEKSPPPHLFAFFHAVYQQANKGNFVAELSHTIFTEPEGFLGSKDHGGFLYIRPTYQCLHKLVLPPAPYVFALLIQKWETPWAKVFPLRLMLRLGAEFRYYPCPLVSARNRKPVYCEIGHTIMNLLVDFRNYTYTIPSIQGFMIHMEDKKTTLLIPRNRYEQILKALNNSNDHVLALGANFSLHADSHLVTVEDDDGQYSTQAINIHNKPRKVTGASFIVFNGALKTNSGLKAKSSIVEDGLMVQISGEMMTTLRESLRCMKDFDIPCGPSIISQPDEVIFVRWVQDDKNFNIGIKSPIDSRQMDGIPSVKIDSGTDYVSSDYLIRWTEVFIIQGETSMSNNDINISRLSESLARACCMALIPHLSLLYETGPNRLALRATIHQDNVEYEAGMGGVRLHPVCMKELDSELIPVIHRAASSITDQAVVLELLFHIMEQ